MKLGLPERSMPVTADKPAPYATSGSILDLINRHRDRGLPPTIDNDALGRIGIPPTLIPRTLQALHTLDLIDPKTGTPTKTFETLRLAPEDEFKDRMAAWLKGAYADVFSFVDPAKDGEARIRDAFRTYQPVGQQERMVLLFRGLCMAAGLLTAEKSPRAPSSPTAAPTSTPRQRTAVKRIVNERFKGAPRHPSSVPAPLAGLLASLPAEGDTWTKDERAKFITTFTAVLDFCFPVEDAEVGKVAGGH
jgi:hypothetical protein